MNNSKPSKVTLDDALSAGEAQNKQFQISGGTGESAVLPESAIVTNSRLQFNIREKAKQGTV